MRRFRYYSRLLKAFLGRFKFIIAGGILAGIAIFLLLNYGLLNFAFTKTERIGIAGRYTTSSLPDLIQNEISTGITRIDETGSAAPGLASSWETPDKGKTWTFNLAENYWQDGDKVVASDIVFDLEGVEVSYPDDSTLEFKLVDAFSPFPVVLAKPVFKRGLLGTGEWEVAKVIVRGEVLQELVLKSDKGKKVYKFYPTFERAALALKLGEVDEIKDLFDTSSFTDWGTVDIEGNIDEGQIVTLFVNIQDGQLAEKSLRQALAYGIDKQSFEGSRAISPLPKSSWAYNPQVKPYNYDPERARELLSDIGYSEGDLQITLVSTPALLSVAEKIVEDLSKVGVKVNLQVSSRIPDDFQLFLAVYDVPDDPDQYSVWHSTQFGSNISKYSNPRIDKLLEEGRSELDSEKRRGTYLDFQRFLLEDLPAIFLYNPTRYDIVRK